MQGGRRMHGGEIEEEGRKVVEKRIEKERGGVSEEEESAHPYHGGIRAGGTKNPPENPATALMTGERR